jgi:hypothetical protein
MPAADALVVAILRRQSLAGDKLGSPFTAGLLRHIADDAEAGGPSAPLLAPWAGRDHDTVDQALPGMRIMAALHDLALSGEDPALAAVYPRPDAPIDPDAAWGPVRAALAREPARLAAFMTHEPQTNEVGRAAMMVGAFLVAAQATGLPFRCFELGASAGLNLNWDRFRYQLGDLAWGDPRSEVMLAPDWTGAAPPDAQVRVIERAACDRRPIDITDPAEARRLMAYVWADQFQRLARLRAAIALARRIGVKVEAADAADWTRARAAPAPGALTIVYHSVFWQYVPAAGQAALRAAIEAHAAQATAEAPFAWLRMEPTPPAIDNMHVRLTLWPGGEEQVLAKVHPHGAWVRWLAEPPRS